jgi:hypothetical protein
VISNSAMERERQRTNPRRAERHEPPTIATNTASVCNCSRSPTLKVLSFRDAWRLVSAASCLRTASSNVTTSREQAGALAHPAAWGGAFRHSRHLGEVDRHQIREFNYQRLLDAISYLPPEAETQGVTSGWKSTFFEQYASTLLKTRYGDEIWPLYERGLLRPETELTGTFVHETARSI